MGEVAACLWWDWPAACREQQWKSHSVEVGEPRVCEGSCGWWRRAAAPAHSTVCVCRAVLSSELPCRDSCRGEGAPLMMGRAAPSRPPLTGLPPPPEAAA